MKAWLLLLSLFLVTIHSEEIPVRLAEGRIFEAGLVEVWKDGAWGLLCDRGRRTWDQAKAHLVCQQLGFPRAVEGKVNWGDSPVVKVPRGARIAATALSCNQGESQFGGCSLQWGQQCPDQDAVSVVCQPQSRSACGQVCVLITSQSCLQLHSPKYLHGSRRVPQRSSIPVTKSLRLRTHLLEQCSSARG